MTTAIASLGFLSDNETKVDLLNNEAIAKTIIRLLHQHSDNPITVGVHGDWGAGKSSILEMIYASFEDDDDTVCLKFNGWQFQGFEDAKIALIEGVLKGLVDSRPFLASAVDTVKRAWNCLDKLKFLKGAGKFGVALTTGIPLHGAGLVDMATSLGSMVTSVGGNAATLLSDEDKRSAIAENFEGVVKEDAKFGRPKASHEIAEFRKAFKELIKEAKIKRLVVLVDDLDRCLPETAIETLEAIRLFVLMEKTAFVVGADERMIEYAVHRHFPNLPQMEDSQGYARAYLEKLLQVPFRIPSLGDTETRIYTTLLLLGAVSNDTDRFNILLDMGRKALRSPWDSTAFTDVTIREALAEISQSESAAIVMAEQISPLLASGTRGNPRQIKRFLNALTLRLAISEARGFGNAILPERLAKLMLAELFLPDNEFLYIASSAAKAPDGVCMELAELESFAKGGKPAPVFEDNVEGLQSPEEAGDGETGPSKPTTPDSRNSVLLDWQMRPDVVKWARVEPDLHGVDLKPYLFVIKDKKNYLSSSAPLSSKLRDLAAKLTGGDLNAATVRPMLKSLNASEIETVFNAVRSDVLSSPHFNSKPPALAGVSMMVEQFPLLDGIAPVLWTPMMLSHQVSRHAQDPSAV